MASLLTPPYLQFFKNDGSGLPLSGGKVNTYTATGTFATRKATFTTEVGDVEHPNPVILNANGIPETGNGSIWGSGTYDIRVTDENDVEIESTLNVTVFRTTDSSSNAYFESFSGDGAETEFTTSESLGTDEKSIYVWVDAGGGKGYDLQAPSAYTIDGTTLTFSVAPASGTNNIYVSAPSTLVGAAAISAASAADSAAAALASETQAGAYAGQLTIVSTTSLAIGTGSKVFTVASGLSLSAGQFIIMASDAAPTTNYMWGQIASYSGTTLTITVAATLGSGTYADWTGYLTGERGATGATGSVSDISGVSVATPADDDTFIFTDISDSNATKKAGISTIAGSPYFKTGYITNKYYFGSLSPTTPASFSADILYGNFFVVTKTTTFTRIGLKQTSTGTATAARLGIYTLVDGVPTDLVLDAGTVDMTTPSDKEVTISQQLSAGLYIMCSVQNGTGTLQVGVGNDADTAMAFGADASNGTINSGVQASFTYGVLPSTFPSFTYINSGTSPTQLPLYWLRVV